MTGLNGLTSKLIACALALVAGALGGLLLFSALPAPFRGVGLALIVLLPWIVAELTKERPELTRPSRKRPTR